MFNSSQAFNTSNFGSAGGFGASPAGERTREKRSGEPLLPVTCTMIQGLMNSEEKITLGQKEFSQVAVMGKVTSVNTKTSSAQIDYQIQDDENDKNAVVNVRQFMNSEGTTPEFMEETWIKVVGKIRSFNNDRSITAFKIFNVDSEAERDVHMLEAKYAKLFYEKDILGRINDEKLSGVNRGLSGTAFALKESANITGAQSVSFSGDNSGAPPAKVMKGEDNFLPMQTASGLEGIRAQVCELLRKTGHSVESGLSVADIQGRLPGVKIGPIREALDYLQDEGHIFTTIDGDHYQFCM